MKTHEGTEFWPLLDGVMCYAVDTTDPYPLLWGSTRVGEIDQDTFLKRLYVCRDEGRYEERLAEAMLSALHLLVVASPRGSGKTSAIYYACNIITRDPANQETRVVLIDFRRLYDREGLDRSSPAEAEAKFRKLIENEVRPYFFKDVDATRSYLAWILAGEPDEGTPFERILTGDLLDIATVVQAEARAELPSRSSRYHRLKQWFTDYNDRYVSILREVQPLLRVAHVVAAAHTIFSLDKVVLVYDNVDKIPPEHQRAFVEVADNSQAAMGRIATTCIAIRTETLPGQSIPAENRGGSVIDLILPNEKEYPTILLPPPELDHVNAVLDQRNAFAHDLCETISPDTRKRKAAKVVHRVVIQEFSDSAIHHLTNESMRGVINIYRGFTRYLDTLREKRDIDLAELFSTEKLEGHAHTLFYLWLGVFGKRFGIYLYDILKLDPDETDAPFHELASEHYFLLTALANLTRDEESRLEEPPYPRFSQVVKRMSELGFSFAQVIDAVDVMCTRRNEDTRTIEFYDSEPQLGNLGPNAPNRIRLTLLGNVLLSRVLSKVGYVWRSAHEYGPDRSQRPEEAYLDLTPARRIRTILRYIRHLAGVHLKLLTILRLSWEPRFGDAWLNALRRMFGIDRKLQLERVLLDAAKFYKRHLESRGLENQFDVLGKLYAALLCLVEKGDPYEEELRAGFEEVELTIEEMIKREPRDPRNGTWDAKGGA